MNILDENVFASQRADLRRRRMRIRQIGLDIGRSGMQDDEIITLLHGLMRPTFFTRDQDFFKRKLRHPRYCLVWLGVDPLRTSAFVTQVLRHPECNTQAKRMGSVIRASIAGMRIWRGRARSAAFFQWKT